MTLLGAHVSTEGGVAEGPPRGGAIGATAIQLFTKTPNQWREPAWRIDSGRRWRSTTSRWWWRTTAT